jgi:hypothetical protein
VRANDDDVSVSVQKLNLQWEKPVANDTQKLINEIATRNHILVDRDDPVFAVSAINRLMLDEAAEILFERMRVVIAAFETSARDVETHAGKKLAEDAHTLISAWKAEIAKDLNIANARYCEMIDRIHRAHSKQAMVRGGVLSLFASLLLIGCGILIGIYFR